MQHFLDANVRCLFIQITGLLDLPQAKEYARRARLDPRYENDFDVLTDISFCELKMEGNDLRAFADFMNKNWPTQGKIKGAILLQGQFAHGMARMYDAYTHHRVNRPAFFHREKPDLYKEICSYFGFPTDYQLPEFLDAK
ncbi:hypothetical protein [Sneathiella glossodoripedis]|uniref:hypothetical protein n=1 Tax=Sneathiella glossodoripedis TaxID=418853 RepID=UPI0011DD5E2C|nr:hypothetical protein [Sneathiella glossodoripedis]